MIKFKIKWISVILPINTIDFLHFTPYPKGCEENQFAPFRDWGKQIEFR